jgi:hypothetical protein
LLWSIVINDVLKASLPSAVKIQAFADDLVISLAGVNKSHMEKLIQNARDDIINWENSVRLIFFNQKTEMIVFSRKNIQISNFHLTVNGLAIAQKNKVSKLGVILNQRRKLALLK